MNTAFICTSGYSESDNGSVLFITAGFLRLTLRVVLALLFTSHSACRCIGGSDGDFI